MFNKNIKKNLKKVVALGVALAGISGIGAMGTNSFNPTNVHAESINQLLNKARHSTTGGTLQLSHKQQELSGAYDGDKNDSDVLKPATHRNPNKNCKVTYRPIRHKAHKYVARRTYRVRKARKHVARRVRKARKNTRGYKNYEVKNLAVTLNRLDKKVVRSHGRKRAYLIRNMRHVNGRLMRMVGRKGRRTTRGYKNHESKNIAITLNRVDAKAVKSHGRKYANLIKNLKHCNYTLIQLAK